MFFVFALEFASIDTSRAFFRAESRVSRDLAVLTANRTSGGLVVDAFSGTGARAVRYATDLDCRVVANEPNLDSGLFENVRGLRVETRHEDATELLRSIKADVVDADSFGLSFDVGAAVAAANDRGIVLLATTGAAAAGAGGPAGRRAMLARLGATAGTPHNEIGLRILAGRAVASAAQAGDALVPLWCLYSPHGPVFRVAGRVFRRRKSAARDLFHRYYRFVDDARPLDWDSLGAASGNVSGPLWTGPLHDRDTLADMTWDARDRGWLGGGVLEKTLTLMSAEVKDPALDAVPLAFSLDHVARLAGVRTPPRDDFARALQTRGFRAAPTHLDRKALRTTAPLDACVRLASECYRSSSSSA
ncbi:hypothetical protein CTAYLR_003323 [Chrysophaeum taylorii]|uniref:tRNA (guanine(26)-N(2))-dimethyltransferase n=1 Tax=Chrysophaeum taylorii TaxID=2483200 RepID=A0AAD7XQQ1_9STRA|nr:hypothetical protein CTAYLR_003323 [Chrysophaeum taylorii]